MIAEIIEFLCLQSCPQLIVQLKFCVKTKLYETLSLNCNINKTP